MKKVLIVAATGMGDCLFGTPGIRALKKTFPEVEIDLVVNRPWKSLFEFSPHLNQIFEYRSQWYFQPFLGIQLFGRHYDAIYIFHANRNFKRMLPWFRSKPVWCHQNFNWIPESQRVKINVTAHGIHKNLSMLDKFDVNSDGGQMEIFFDPATLDKSQQFLKDHGFSAEKYIYLNVGAAVESRRWMIERFSELASRILKTTSWNVILGGGPGDKKRTRTIMKQLDSLRVLEVCSQPLLLNAAIISKARLMVTADTGPMHIGLAMKTPVVALFGSIPLVFSGPYEIPDYLCRVIKIDPKDNLKNPELDERHFKNITVDHVWEQVEKMLAEKSIP